MALLGGSFGYNILRAYAGNGKKPCLAEATSYAGKNKLEILPGVLDKLQAASDHRDN